MAKSHQSLSAKHSKFVQEYLKHPHATDAYQKVYKCSRPAADANGSKLLANARIRDAIATGRQKLAEQANIDALDILLDLHGKVKADLADLYDQNGSLRPIEEWSMPWRQGLVAGLDTTRTTVTGEDGEDRVEIVTKLRLADRTRLIQLLGEHVDVGAFAKEMHQKNTQINIHLSEHDLKVL